MYITAHYSVLERKLASLSQNPRPRPWGLSRETEPVINLDGEIVEAVNHFRYLGSEVMPFGRLDEELQNHGCLEMTSPPWPQNKPSCQGASRKI